MTRIVKISNDLLTWWDDGHADLPWRRSGNPYHIWVSEIMLQQTQIATMLPYFDRWMLRFPTIATLSNASLDDVLKLWEGLGYYSRARNLHTAAQMVMEELDGQLPTQASELQKLKGIGRYTANAIASIAFNQAVPVVDGNVIRILSRLTDLPDDTTKTATKNKLWQLAGTLIPNQRTGDYNQALMELGQTICKPATPHCHICPLITQCLARQRGTQHERPLRPKRKKIPHFAVAAGVIFREDAKFLIAQRPLDGLLGGLWEFPGGKQEAGETLEQTLVREIQEELAVDIRPNYCITTVKHAFTHFRITLHAYHATFLSGEIQHIGIRNHAWVTLDDLDSYAFGTADRKVIATLQANKLAA